MNESQRPLASLLEFSIASRHRLRELAGRHEAERRVGPELVRELAALGAFRLLVPSELGGGEGTPSG
ncbi:MAG: hypothetical protein KC492_38755, partial [Myxococcales bacterium]|nr:hypothetical protein [Myxococcales bacterium]